VVPENHRVDPRLDDLQQQCRRGNAEGDYGWIQVSRQTFLPRWDSHSFILSAILSALPQGQHPLMLLHRCDAVKTAGRETDALRR
jgi:hypothetical protein